MNGDPRIIRREQSARSRQHRGVLTQVIYERDGLEILRTEMDPGSVWESEEFADFSSVHFVIDGTPAFRTAKQATDLMPGDSIVFSDNNPFTISNNAPARSVFVSVLFQPCNSETQSTQTAVKETLA